MDKSYHILTEHASVQLIERYLIKEKYINFKKQAEKDYKKVNYDEVSFYNQLGVKTLDKIITNGNYATILWACRFVQDILFEKDKTHTIFMIVGGAIRDLLLCTKQPHDLDIAIFGDYEAFIFLLQNVLCCFGELDIKITESNPIWTFKFRHEMYEIAPYRIGEIYDTSGKLIRSYLGESHGFTNDDDGDHKFIKSLVLDSSRRDFSINTLGLLFHPRFGEWNIYVPKIKSGDAYEHLMNKELHRIKYKSSLIDDPARIIRIIKFAIMGFNYKKLLPLQKQEKDALRYIQPHRIENIFLDFLKNVNDIKKALLIMIELDIIEPLMKHIHIVDYKSSLKNVHFKCDDDVALLYTLNTKKKQDDFNTMFPAIIELVENETYNFDEKYYSQMIDYKLQVIYKKIDCQDMINIFTENLKKYIKKIDKTNIDGFLQAIDDMKIHKATDILKSIVHNMMPKIISNEQHKMHHIFLLALESIIIGKNNMPIDVYFYNLRYHLTGPVHLYFSENHQNFRKILNYI